jgi:ParB/RepB/Spo0J family partition protein
MDTAPAQASFLTREVQERHNGNGPPARTLAEEVTLLPVALIDHDPKQPRKTMDRATIAELAANIREHSLQQPIHVRPGPTGRFTEMIGARRLEAVKLLGWEEIPAFVHSGPLDAEKLRLVQVSENLLREDVNPMEQALALKECLGGGTASALAAKLGVSVAFVTTSLSLAEKLPADVQGLVRQGVLPGTVARELTRAASDEHKRELAQRYVAGELKTRGDVIAAIKAAKNGPGRAPAVASFTVVHAGVRISVTVPHSIGADQAEAACRHLAGELKKHGRGGWTHFTEYLDKKAQAARKAAESKAAQDELDGLSDNATLDRNGGN